MLEKKKGGVFLIRNLLFNIIIPSIKKKKKMRNFFKLFVVAEKWNTHERGYACSLSAKKKKSWQSQTKIEKVILFISFTFRTCFFNFPFTENFPSEN